MLDRCRLNRRVGRRQTSSLHGGGFSVSTSDGGASNPLSIRQPLLMSSRWSGNSPLHPSLGGECLKRKPWRAEWCSVAHFCVSGFMDGGSEDLYNVASLH
ncbi:uncharacterized protein [Physcomitrium patens]|uniref:uncharacterized protein isoform X2 n=1 Tax=Physcomitrium patens TaxID=3218 RepID=UPI003CCCB9BC